MCITYILACNLCRLPNVKAEADNCLQVTNGRLAPSEFHNYTECPVATPTTTIPVTCQIAAIIIPMLKANSLAQLCVQNIQPRKNVGPFVGLYTLPHHRPHHLPRKPFLLRQVS